MKYKLDYKYGFPVIINFYYENSGDIGFIEIYRTGKLYTDVFDGGISYKTAMKMLKIAKKELIKQKIRTWWKIS